MCRSCLREAAVLVYAMEHRWPHDVRCICREGTVGACGCIFKSGHACLMTWATNFLLLLTSPTLFPIFSIFSLGIMLHC